MAQPSWVTGSGSLGTIPEGTSHRASLEAYDPDFPADSSKVKYIKVAGSLPKGIHINDYGVIEGTPSAYVQGTPLPVSKNITSKFSIRVYTETIVNGSLELNSLNDRTFSITVTGQDAPEFVTPSGELGKFYNGDLVNKQIEFTDSDPGDTAVVSLINGNLPQGVSINSDGLIHGYISALQDVGDANAGWENEAWDAYPLQFNTPSISKNYEFTIKISDGVDSNIRKFSIFVGIITVDSTAQTCDSDVIRADVASRTPYIKNYTKDLGTLLHNNHVIHKFEGIDFNDDTLNYSYTGSLPLGLTLDVNTGIMHGILTDIGLTESELSFSINVYKKENPIISAVFPFTITVVGDIDTGVTWISNTDLGTIDNGSVSHLSVKATSINTDTTLKYRLKSGGVHNKLPQGLSIFEYGNIVGAVNYNMFGVHDYRTTCDDYDIKTDTSLLSTDLGGSEFITFDNSTTTFDSKFEFTIEAYTEDGTISTFKTFNITLNRKYNIPLHSIQLNGLVPSNSKLILDSLLNADVIKPALLYRADDPRFGMSTEITYSHAYGLSPELLSSYVESMEFNHYDKRLILGNISTAIATDDNGNVIYEVVYSNIIDKLVNAKGESVNNTVVFNDITVYPNSLINMRDRVVDKVGQMSSELPRWMLSEQKNGNVLGFTPAWVIAYTLPGQSETVAYSINSNTKIKLNEVDLSVDRYILESQFTGNWNAEDRRWNTYDSTSFDIYEHAYSVDSTAITSDNSASGSTLDASSFDNTSTETIFDNDTCVFIGIRNNSADITIKTADDGYITADNGLKDTQLSTSDVSKFNKYLKFPKRNIL